MTDHRESSDAYYAVVAVLNDRWRVIDSRERYPYRQWVLQQRTRNNPNNAWEGKSFYQSREGLLRTIREKVGQDIAEEAQRVLSGLPDRDMGMQIPKEIAI